MKKTPPVLLLAAALAAPLHANSQAPVDKPEHRWNLAALYADSKAWNDDVSRLEKDLADFAACKGKLGESARRLRECLDRQSDLLRRYYRVAVYAYEFQAEDTGAPAGTELQQKAGVMGAKATEATSFVRPELLALGKAKVDQFFAEEPGLKIYRHPVDDILRAAPHTLDAQGEAIVATFALVNGATGNAYNILANADMPWPTVKLADGTTVKLDQSAYTKHRAAQNRDDRKAVMDAFFGKWKEYERTVGVTLYESLKEDTAYARVRKYPDSLARSLDRYKVPVAVYDALVKSTNANLPTLHRYFKLRGRILGVPEVRYYDIYPALVGGGRKYPIDEGLRIMYDAAKPLGPEYVDAIRKGVKDRWMDVYPRPRKMSGAHMAGSAYDVHPYVLMNYNDDYESVTTLVHEWGHAMHSYLSNRAQPFATANYSVFIAEIASTTNEALLLEHMLKGAANDDERLLYLGSALETLRGTYFRQTMFAEFERAIHAVVDKGEPLSGAKLTQMYGEILRRYHGHDQGVLKVDDLYAIEWAYIPHFYFSFYVFQYATSIAAGSLFGDAILRGDAGARERYLNLLKAGSSDYPYELVKAAGVDLASPAPYDAMARRMDRIMDDIEKILARRGK